MLCEMNSPYRLKAGIIGRLNLKSSIWNLFSESFKMEITDVHFIVGPSRDHVSDPRRDFPADCADVTKLSYDCEEQDDNLIRMFDFVRKAQ